MGLHEYVKTCFQSNSSTRWIASSLPASPSVATQQKLLLLHPPMLLPALGMGTHVVPAGGKPALRKGAPKLQFSWQLQRSPLEQSLVTEKPSPVHCRSCSPAPVALWCPADMPLSGKHTFSFLLSYTSFSQQQIHKLVLRKALCCWFSGFSVRKSCSEPTTNAFTALLFPKSSMASILQASRKPAVRNKVTACSLVLVQITAWLKKFYRTRWFKNSLDAESERTAAEPLFLWAIICFNKKLWRGKEREREDL